jgi:hypothetical protein
MASACFAIRRDAAEGAPAAEMSACARIHSTRAISTPSRVSRDDRFPGAMLAVVLNGGTLDYENGEGLV